MHCRAHAYELFTCELPHLETTQGLWRAAIAVSMHELDDVDPVALDDAPAAIARQVRDRVRSDHPEALLAHLHEVMFDELGFTGNTEDYYDAANSYVPLVLERRLGLPITLTLVYKCVAERVGLRVHGVNAPWHFIAEVELDEGAMLVDPFCGGRTLKPAEAFEQMQRAGGLPVPRDKRLLKRATHRQWLARILQNLMNVFHGTQREEDLAAMVELQQLLS